MSIRIRIVGHELASIRKERRREFVMPPSILTIQISVFQASTISYRSIVKSAYHDNKRVPPINIDIMPHAASNSYYISSPLGSSDQHHIYTQPPFHPNVRLSNSMPIPAPIISPVKPPSAIANMRVPLTPISRQVHVHDGVLPPIVIGADIIVVRRAGRERMVWSGRSFRSR